MHPGIRCQSLDHRPGFRSELELNGKQCHGFSRPSIELRVVFTGKAWEVRSRWRRQRNLARDEPKARVLLSEHGRASDEAFATRLELVSERLHRRSISQRRANDSEWNSQRADPSHSRRALDVFADRQRREQAAQSLHAPIALQRAGHQHARTYATSRDALPRSFMGSSSTFVPNRRRRRGHDAATGAGSAGLTPCPTRRRSGGGPHRGSKRRRVFKAQAATDYIGTFWAALASRRAAARDF